MSGDTSWRQAPTACPACGGVLHVTALGCASCGTGVTGHFATATADPGPLARLSAGQASVVLALLAARGDRETAARSLGTDLAGLDAALDEVDDVLGLGSRHVDREQPPQPLDGDLLGRVQRGEVSPEDAARLLGARTAPAGGQESRDLTEAKILRRVEAGELDPLEGARLIQSL